MRPTRPGQPELGVVANAVRIPPARRGDLRSQAERRAGARRLRTAAVPVHLVTGDGTVMKIAQIAPLYESCPPRLYGGTERVVFYLTEELVRLGHEVTLFASGDSQSSAKLVPGCEAALRLDGRVKDPLVYHMTMLDRVRRQADQF